MEVEIKVRRFNGEKSYWQKYRVPVLSGMTVLDALLYIKENIDATLSFRYSCRMGVCGSCAVKINNKPRLACETQILQLKDVQIEPINNFRVIKDLITDFDDFFAKHRIVKPYLIRKNDSYEKPVEMIQTPKQLKKYYRYSLCIKCGACNSVCPVSSTRDDYLGPAIMTTVYRFMTDNRDEGKDERFKIVSSERGVWRCHFASECSEVCPKNVEPAKAVQKLRIKSIIYEIKKFFK